MLIMKRLAIVPVLLLTTIALAQQPAPTSAVKTVEVKASVSEAEVGQKVKLTVVAKDAAGNVVNEQPASYFAGPFDIAAADDRGTVSLFGPGEVTAGAVFANSKTGFTTFMVKPARIKTVEIKSITTPVVAGGTVQLEAITRISSGDPRTGVPIKWTSDKPGVATVDAGGVVTGIAPGQATVRAATEAASGMTTITVVKSNLRSLTIEPASTAALTGDVVHLTAKGTPASNFTARWSVTGAGATVYPDGAFVAEQPGTYIINASSGSVAATAAIVVTPRNAEREMEVVGRAPLKEFQGAEEWIIGNYAYYSTITDRFLVYDISDPAHPKLTDTVTVDARLVNDIMTTADGQDSGHLARRRIESQERHCVL